jgi:septum formation protein
VEFNAFIPPYNCEVLFLASKSPRRHELLRLLGLDFSVLEIDVVEEPQPGEVAEDYVRRVTREKAGAGLLEVASVPGAVVLAADTEVVLDDVIFGKPKDDGDAVRMLKALSGRTHRVMSAVCAIDAGREFERLNVSEVRFATVDDARIRAYVATGEPLGKAGAYGIQGRAAAFIEHLSGSYTGVMGLPLYETAEVLAGLGFMQPR